MYSFTSLLTH